VLRFPGEWKETVSHFLAEVDGAANGRQPMRLE
jgi:hypothetical protein